MGKITICLLLAIFATVYGSDESYSANKQFDDTPEERLDNTILSGVRLAGIVDHVNSLKTTWTAGVNFSPETPASYLKRLAGSMIETANVGSIPTCRSECEAKGLPKEFDARKKWPKCASIKTVHDQGNCGSCWAVSAATTLTDRLCIQSKGTFTTQLSSQALNSCCHVCSYKNGCNGGWPSRAWKFFQRHGLVTGGLYNSTEGCQPYLQTPCDHHVENPTLPSCSSLPKEQAPRCKLHCYNSNYQTPWKKDLHKVKRFSFISPCHAMKDILHHGPLQATFVVYEDFYTYKSGVYQYTVGKRVGGHAVKVIGWGEENGVPYWLVMNSWNEHWGAQGLFKILRNHDECNFESHFMGGKLKL